MLVQDINNRVADYIGACAQDQIVYELISSAIEVLGSKGSWDSMQAYLDIVVGSGNVLTLPPDCANPIKININNSPSFSRSRFYEFSLSGPGSDMADTSGFSWMDLGSVPVFAQPATPSQVKTISSASDNGKAVSIFGRDSDGIEISDDLILNSATPPISVNTYTVIDRVIKDVTVANVSLQTQASAVLSLYRPNETEPQYKQIRLTKAAAAVRMLYRRKTNRVTSDSDYIPLQSRQAILMMVKALRAYENDNPDAIQKGDAFEQKAVQYLKEEQDARNNFDLVQSSESQPALDLNYNNADSIIVSDIYDDAAAIFGPIGRDGIYDKITESVELLANKALWDGLEGYVDLITDNYHYVTLPRYVEEPVAINVGGQPKVMRNRWFEFHLNGPGSNSCYCGGWDKIGEVITIHPITAISQLIYQPDKVEDDDKKIRIYGWDENLKWIRTEIDGTEQDGFEIAGDHTGHIPDSDAQKVTKIDRITRESTQSFAKLIAYDPVAETALQIGFYYPDETEPKYSRIKIADRCAWVRMKYRKRTLKVTSLTDPIHLKSKLAVVAAMKSMKALLDGDFSKSQAWEEKATQFLNEEQNSRNPGEVFHLQISADNTCPVL